MFCEDGINFFGLEKIFSATEKEISLNEAAPFTAAFEVVPLKLPDPFSPKLMVSVPDPLSLPYAS